MFRAGGHADPATIGNRAKTFGKTGRGADDAVFKTGRGLVTGAVQRGEHGFAKARGFGQDGVDGFGGGIGIARGGGDLGKIQDVVKQEAKICNWGAIGHRGSSLAALLGKGRAAL